ncbi:MAG: redox-regulated ATPase YchF [Candidatus Moranbacteria bacterium]|nr:redox-regulated ATPase YchF [Candidatus Moranbacteria bacterium]
MQIGIVGLPNVGKSTLFKALTKIQVDISNYPFCTIEPNTGIVEVPDERIDKLTELSSSKKKIYSTIEFVDIAGLVEGAADGQGLGNKFLHNIREVDAIVQVVRLFKNSDITHVKERINPKEDIEIINTELILADLETVKKRIEKIKKQAKTGDKETLKILEITEKLEEVLNSNDLEQVQTFIKSLEDDFELIQDLCLLAFKPVLYVLNTNQPEEIEKELAEFELSELIDNQQNYVALDIKIEEELLDLSDEDQQELELKSELDELIKKSYGLLNLMTYLTTGEAETRAWQTPIGSTAPEAGRAIHSDFQEKFIKAEIISYQKLIEVGSRSKARDLGWLQTVGKDYIVQDGDVVEFKI